MSVHVKRGDTVLVIAGKDKGKKGKIMSCDPDGHKAKVDGINVVTKHSKPKNRETAGGIRKIVGNIDTSNLMVICPACDKATRLGHKELDNGKKVRACKKCGANVEPQIKGKDKDKDKKKKADKSAEVEAVSEDKATKAKAPAKKSTAKAKTETKAKTESKE
ncbi:MAG: 50S ribosomal protein L24 [Firmicutes bacterium]|nr:50S ribosomal protein L24 [Bacillota bacterium]